jgi:hypothetical protein
MTDGSVFKYCHQIKGMPGRNVPLGNAEILTILLFVAVSAVLIANHEPWRDEAQIWLIGRDLPDAAHVIAMTPYEGCPVLWILMVFFLAKAGLPYISMFILHFLLMLIGVVVFLVYAPFSRVQKILFSFGYYIIYLYNIVARNYVLFALFLILIAAAHKDRLKRPFLYSVLIILLANTSVHGLVVAIVLALVYLFEIAPWRYASMKKFAAPMLIIILGILAAIFQLIPTEDMGPRAVWYLSTDRFGIVTNSALRAFFPVSQSMIGFAVSLIGIPVFLLSLCFFIRKPKAMAIYSLSALGILALSFLKGYGGARHDGLIFISFVFCLWISENYNDVPLVKNRLLSALSKKRLSLLFTLILAFHMLSAAAASYMELTEDFSAGKRAAAFLEANGFAGNDTFIASYPSYSASTILPFMPGEHPKFYYLEYQDFMSFMIWNEKYYANKNLSIDEIISRVDNAVTGKNFKSVLIMLNRNETDPGFAERYEPVASFGKAITSDEVYYIYRLRQPQ